MSVGVEVRCVGWQAENSQPTVERFGEFSDHGAAMHTVAIDDERDRRGAAPDDLLEKIDKVLGDDVALCALFGGYSLGLIADIRVSVTGRWGS